MERALSGSDIIRIMRGRVKVLAYPRLRDFDSIDELFRGSHGNVVINYLATPEFGHWVCLKKRGRVISFFDSYGSKPDAQLAKLSGITRDALGERRNLLLELFRKVFSEYKFEYNEEVYQREGRMSCGYWCCHFLMFNGGINDYQSYLSTLIVDDYDDYIVKCISKI